MGYAFRNGLRAILFQIRSLHGTLSFMDRSKPCMSKLRTGSHIENGEVCQNLLSPFSIVYLLLISRILSGAAVDPFHPESLFPLSPN
jgi:hypothetical protein